MDTRETVAFRIRQLCAARKITPNGLANLSAVPQATIKSILNDESKNPGRFRLSLHYSFLFL